MNWPSGLSGPAGTTAGRMSPFLACSRRTDSGGYHGGSFTLATTFVTPSGVCQSIFPIATGNVTTTRGSPFFAGG